MVMAEKTVEKQVCPACGADIRPQAVFCYNCGAAVAAPDNAETEPPPREEITEDAEIESKATTRLDENNVKTIDKSFDTVVETSKDNDDAPEKTDTNKTETKLKSAASLRKSARKPMQKKTVEVVWDEPESAPNLWFLVAAFVLSLFAVGILLAMLYIK